MSLPNPQARRHIDAAMRLHQSGRLKEALALYREALELDPRDADALHLYGLCRHQCGDSKGGIPFIRQAVEIHPEQPALHNNLGEALRAAGDREGALASLQRALALRPDYAGVHNNLGNLFTDLGDPDQALFHYRKAMRLAPSLVDGRMNLGLCLLTHGLLAEAAEQFRQALALRPGHPGAACNLLYTLNLIPGLAPEQVYEEHRAWGKWMEEHGGSGLQPRQPRRDPGAAGRGCKPLPRKLRIGYVSRDFRAHAVAYFLEPLLARHDRKGFAIYCYSDVVTPDAVTRRFQGFGHHWREIAGRDDRAVEKMIREDHIDILVDLGGHTEKNRLAVFARRPAPRQVTWLGYSNTTGLKAIDYRITDPLADPPEAPSPASERLLRIDGGFACFRPPEQAGEVSPPPMLRNGHPTFGSLHKLDKINDRVLDLWARLLQLHPKARLLLYRDELNPWQQARLRRAFAGLGIAEERLILRHPEPGKSFFTAFAEIDLMLDLFPWSGHTLCCCALWMGVPVVTLKGNCHAGRMVASVLGHAGLEQWIGDDEEAYLRIAGALIADPQQLAAVRAGLRERMAASPLRDEAGFARKMEEAYRNIVAAQ